MRLPSEILAELERRGWREIAEQVAIQHRVPLSLMLAGCRERDIVDARAALYARLRDLASSTASVARVFGVFHTAVSSACEAARPIAEVVLDRYEVPDPAAGAPIAFVFKWKAGRENAFGVVSISGTEGTPPGEWERRTEWFLFYPRARTRFVTLTRDAGAPSSYAGPSETPQEVETSSGSEVRS